MSKNAQIREGRWSLWRVAGWTLAAMLLLLPLVAMQFTREVNWDAFDFAFAAVLIGSVGLAYELVVRRTRNAAYRTGVAVALAGAFLTIWANAAVGMIGSEDNAINLMFAGVLAVALLGAIVVRLRARGMAAVMVVAAAAQLGAAGIGMFTDVRGGVFAAMFAGIWLLSAAFFRAAAASLPQR